MPPAKTDRREGAVQPLPFRVVIGLLFFLSGAVALIYEGAWQREFTLLFGSAAPATAAVLAAYFTGLGLGAFFVGKLAERSSRPLLIYACLEIGIALGALLVTSLLNLYAGFYPELFERFHGGRSFLWIKAGLAFLSILLPTFAMGGTLPILAQLFEGDRAHFGRSAGWLYLLNTLGAALGVLAFPALLGAIGLRSSTYLCVVVNLVIAAAAIVLSSKTIPLGRTVARTVSKERTAITTAAVRWCLALAFISGFSTFTLQVGWNRAFAQVHENSVQSFTLIVALFILAIALGAQLSRVLLRRRWAWQNALGACWILGGAFLLVAPHLFLTITENLRFVPPEAGAFNKHLLFPGLLVMIPVALVAVSLPMLLQALANSSQRSVGDFTGRTLSSNIAGSVMGALLAGFVLPRYLGLWSTIISCGLLVGTAGMVLVMKSQGARIGSVSVLLFFGWVLARADLPRTRVDFSRGEKLLHLREGTHGIVAVTERGPSRRLKLNNYYVLGGTSATGDERLQGHIPFLLHPEARSAAFLGYGTGISAGSAMFHPVTNVLALELVPEVAEVAAAYFAEPNARFASRHPVIIEDARNYLRGSTNQFDLIIGDLVVPWRHGEGALYTLEHFQAARARLAPSGVYCCWLPMFQLGRADFEVIVRTFLQVFPSAQIWRGDFSPTEPALALVSLPPDHVVDLRLDRMQADPSNAQLKFPSAFWMHYVGSITNIAPGHLNTQDRQLLELRSVRAKPFVGRALAQWERELTAQSLSLMENRLTNEGRAGVSAGELMREFTLLLSENRRNEAEAVAQRIRAVLGDEAAQTVLGP